MPLDMPSYPQYGPIFPHVIQRQFFRFGLFTDFTEFTDSGHAKYVTFTSARSPRDELAVNPVSAVAYKR